MPVEYEITYLVDPSLDDEKRGELDASIDAEITKLGGAIAQSNPHARRRLHYPIHKQMVASLRTVNIQVDPSQMGALRVFLKKEPGILRSTLIETPPRLEITPEMLFKAPSQEIKAKEDEAARPSKPVTIEEVEKGIEEALKEEVK